MQDATGQIADGTIISSSKRYAMLVNLMISTSHSLDAKHFDGCSAINNSI
jgi:hypothetical protein